MSDKSKIEWTDATWNPITGCTKVSEGCRNCYAKTFAERFEGTPGHYFESGFNVTLRPDKLDQPYRWKRPRKIFVNSMSDLFHDDIPDHFIWSVFQVMARCPQHTFQVLTKRPERMVQLLQNRYWRDFGDMHALIIEGEHRDTDKPFLPNVWLGVSVEDQKAANDRIPLLLQTPAAKRFLSCEPLLGEVKILHELMGGKRPGKCGNCGKGHGFDRCPNYGGISKTDKEYGCNEFKRVDFAIDWVIAGGESGSGARPMHPEWVRSLREQCQRAAVPFFFKQWGSWHPMFEQPHDREPKGNCQIINLEGGQGYHGKGAIWTKRISKESAGRILDGRTWDEMPIDERMIEA